LKPLARLGIAGVGLIGGSFALALRRAGLVREVVGWGRTRKNLDVALERGILDRADTESGVLEGADALLLATPVATLAAAAREAASRLAEGAVIFDVGSVKQGVVDDCVAALGARAPHFVGCHPVAGNEFSGAAHADPELLRGAPCVLTPVASTDPAALARVRRLWEAAGTRVVEMSPAAHDEWLALLSHLPHLVAFALTSLVAGEDGGTRPEAIALAGPSFRSATRVAASSPEMWRDILLANRTAVAGMLDRFREALGELGAAMERGDGAALAELVARAGARRRSFDGADPASRATEFVTDAVRNGLRGTVDVPGDKSIAHRGLLFGAIASGVTTVIGLGDGEDNASTVHVLRGLGVRIERDGRTARVHGRGFEGLRAPAGVLDCGNSGTTLRLVAGILAGRPFTSRLDGDASLRRRPMRRIAEPLGKLGARIETDSGRPPVDVNGGALRGTRIDLEIASAQVKTSVLLAGLQAEGRTAVREPGASRDHTERLLPAFGVRIARPEPLTVVLDGPQSLRACEVRVPGDPSAAAFWIVAASLVPGSRLVLPGVSVNPTRTGAIDVLRAMGAAITETPRPPLGDEPVADLLVESRPLVARDVGGDEMLRAIDEFPVLAVAAAGATGASRFRDGAELRAKETDRIAAMVEGLERLGVRIAERPDGLDVTGGPIGGGAVESHGDHRVAMAFVVAGLVASAPVTVRGADAIAVSDPGFLATLARLRAGSA
jgi:cyclohexadieny/prephenate dehydrogenase / 3-phosphoshikimate 1-carboxyvinyltransferase